MKILVVSDTHRNFIALKKAFDAVPDADTVVHLGDGESEFALLCSMNPTLAAVYVGGNCDNEIHKSVHIMSAGGLKIFCTHGHRFNVRNGVEVLAAEAKKNDCAIALYGHTHINRTDVVDGVYVMNPGSLDSPRGGTKPSYGIVTIGNKGEISMEIREV